MTDRHKVEYVVLKNTIAHLKTKQNKNIKLKRGCSPPKQFPPYLKTVAQ